jgi:hypothetical protein
MKRPSLDELVVLLSRPGPQSERLAAAGRLVVMGAGSTIGAAPIEIELGIGELEEHAFDALEALDRSAIEDVRRALAPRDEVELRLIGAEAILGRPPHLTIEEEIGLVAFEEALRPHLWRLTALNEWRALEVAWMQPEHRARFWWWAEASDVDPRAAAHLDAVAELVARFPEAEARLTKIAATDLLLRRPSFAVIDLGSWIRSHTLAMAASTGAREQILIEHRSFTLSLLRPATLLVDLLEPCGEHPPRLYTAGAVIESTPVPDALERYQFDVASLPERAELVVTLESGAVRMMLPPE